MRHDSAMLTKLADPVTTSTAEAARTGSFRRLLRQVHLWLALPLGLLLIVVSLTGSALVWRDPIDRLLNPGRYAVSGTAVALPLSAYVANATAAAGTGRLPVRMTMPQGPGWPLIVVLRGATADGKPSRFVTSYLDPATAKVLDIVDAGSTLMGVVHGIHHMLGVPQYSGRQIVGWLGVVLIMLAASGLVLWWPRTRSLAFAFRWRRSTQLSFNLHHMLGGLLALPLIAVCLTGVYLSFPQTAAAFMSSFTALNGARSHGYSAVPLQAPRQGVDEVARLAREAAAGASVLAIHFPTAPRGHGHGHHADPSWRIELGASLNEHATTVAIDDVTGTAVLQPPLEAGDRAVKWIEWIHGARRGDPIWPLLAVASGFAPLLFLVTGIAMWMRRRNGAKGHAKAMQRSSRS